MAKLGVVLLVFVIVSALTLCSASRPISTSTARSTDKSHMTTITSKSIFSSSSASPATESGVVASVEVEEVLTAESEGSFTDVAPPCTEEDLQDSSVEAKRPCHRWVGDGTTFNMLDYSPPKTNPNPKPSGH